MISGQTYPQETLTQAVGAILQHQLVAFLVIWLAVGFPVMCQLHGMMSLYDMEPHENLGHGSADHSEYPCSIHDHSTVPGIAMLLTLITGIVPGQIACSHSTNEKEVSPLAMRWPLQLIALPLERPPRSV